jgi:hypothetical protein
MKKSLVTMACLALCGCTTPRIYTEPGALEKGGGSAMITAESKNTNSFFHGFDYDLQIMSVDGKSTFSLWWLLRGSGPYAGAALVKPGRHHLRLKYSYEDPLTAYEATGVVWFDAEAGKPYIASGRANGYSVFFRMEEGDTHKVVGGLPGGETPLNEQTNQPTATR